MVKQLNLIRGSLEILKTFQNFRELRHLDRKRYSAIYRHQDLFPVPLDSHMTIEEILKYFENNLFLRRIEIPQHKYQFIDLPIEMI